MRAVTIVQRHPAETGGGVAAAVAILLAHVLSLNDPEEVAALVVVVGAVPAVITYAVELVRRHNGPGAPSGGA